MKKLILTTILMFSYGVAHALPVGNPAEASLVPWGVFVPRAPDCNPCDPCFCWFDVWSLRAGFYGDYVFDRNLELDGADFGHGNVIDETTLFTRAGYFALNLADRLDVFGTLGSTEIALTTNQVSWTALANALTHFDWSSAFSWSVGARGTLVGCKGLLIGVEGQFFQTNPKLNRFIGLAGTPHYQYFNENNSMRYREWQVGFGISYAITCFCSKLSLVPYGAAKWARSRFKTNDFTFIQESTGDEIILFDLKSHKMWGYAVGISSTFCDMVCLTLEGRWGDERALYLNGNFRF